PDVIPARLEVDLQQAIWSWNPGLHAAIIAQRTDWRIHDQPLVIFSVEPCLIRVAQPTIILARGHANLLHRRGFIDLTARDRLRALRRRRRSRGAARPGYAANQSPPGETHARAGHRSQKYQRSSP